MYREAKAASGKTFDAIAKDIGKFEKSRDDTKVKHGVFFIKNGWREWKTHQTHTQHSHTSSIQRQNTIKHKQKNETKAHK